MSEQPFAALLDQLRADQDVVGAFLSGSRGKAFHTASSDYDVYVVVQDAAAERTKLRYSFRYSAAIDCIVISLSEFRDYAEWGGSDHWDRYAFAHVKVLFEHTGGTIQKLVEQKGGIPTEHRTSVLRSSLDAYLNAVYRSFKCLKRGDKLGAKLEAAASVPLLLTFLFALESRHAPFAGYLARELETYPLSVLPLPVAEFLAHLDRVLTAEVRAQQTLLRCVDRLGHAEGLENVFKGWDDAYPWMLNFSED